MKVLRKEVTEAISQINGYWVETIKVAEDKKEGIDVTEITGKVIKKIGELNIKFDEAEERMAKQTKKVFGW